MLIASWFYINFFWALVIVTLMNFMLGDEAKTISYSASGVFFAVLGGLVAGTFIGIVTEYYTDQGYRGR